MTFFKDTDSFWVLVLVTFYRLSAITAYTLSIRTLAVRFSWGGGGLIDPNCDLESLRSYLDFQILWFCFSYFFFLSANLNWMPVSYCLHQQNRDSVIKNKIKEIRKAKSLGLYFLISYPSTRTKMSSSYSVWPPIFLLFALFINNTTRSQQLVFYTYNILALEWMSD